MSKRQSAKYKLDRRMGENIWGRAKSPVNKRPYPPGQHGPSKKGGKSAKFSSDFGIQMRAKQKLKGYYGYVSEKQMRAIYEKAVRSKGDTVQIMIGLLESRLDAIVYRSKFAPTIFSARQLVTHGHVLVNGKKIDRPSHLITPQTEIEIKESSHGSQTVLGGIEDKERDVPDYIECDSKKCRSIYMRIPDFLDVPYPVRMEPHLVVEFYSKS